MASGGFTPLQSLRIATIKGAEAIGLAKELGSIEVGKLVKNGRLYAANDLSEVWPRKRATEPNCG